MPRKKSVVFQKKDSVQINGLRFETIRKVTMSGPYQFPAVSPNSVNRILGAPSNVANLSNSSVSLEIARQKTAQEKSKALARHREWKTQEVKLKIKQEKTKQMADRVKISADRVKISADRVKISADRVKIEQEKTKQMAHKK